MTVLPLLEEEIMLKQIKKSFLSLLLVVLLVQPVYAQEDVSDVADQKSVIEEQEILTNYGIAAILDADYSTEIAKYLEGMRNPYQTLILSLTEDERDLIYRITYAEAGNQPIEGQRAVIEVILNRVLSDKFPDSVEEVLSSPGQFSTWKLRNKISYREEQIEAFAQVYSEEPILNKNYVYFSRGKQSYGINHVKIEDHWFSERK